MFIKQVFVKNLWKKGNIIWDLREDVNVLVGMNGSGKSTILNLISNALQPEISEEAKKKYFSLISEITIHFSDDTFIIVDSSGERFPINIDFLNLNLTQISTFDVSSSLDTLIDDLQLEFEIYQKNQYKNLENIIKIENAVPTGLQMEQIFGRRKIFIDTLNNLFKDSDKTFTGDNFNFKLKNQEYELTHKQLSSGEKQLFYILLQILIQNGKDYILLLDEPEISLHIEWQRDLLHNIRQLNPNCQIIAVTHSSNMYFRGWSDCKVNIEEISAKHNNQPKIDLESKLTIFMTAYQSIINNTKILSDRKINEINAMLHKTFFMLSLDECTKILRTLETNSLKPDHFTYSTLISKTTKESDAISLLNEMKAKKISPNAVTYVNILKKTEDFDGAMKVFDLMRKDKIEPAIQHFSALLGKAENTETVQKVEELRSLYEVPSNDIYANKLRIKK